MASGDCVRGFMCDNTLVLFRSGRYPEPGPVLNREVQVRHQHALSGDVIAAGGRWREPWRPFSNQFDEDAQWQDQAGWPQKLHGIRHTGAGEGGFPCVPGVMNLNRAWPTDRYNGLGGDDRNDRNREKDRPCKEGKDSVAELHARWTCHWVADAFQYVRLVVGTGKPSGPRGPTECKRPEGALDNGRCCRNRPIKRNRPANRPAVVRLIHLAIRRQTRVRIID